MRLLDDERWWGGRVADGHVMPFAPGTTVDLEHHRENQACGVLVSNRGRVLWSHEPFAFSVTDATIDITTGTGGVVAVERVGSTLRDASRWAAEHVHHRPRAMPSADMFSPQWATWIEMLYEPTQEATLAYARQIVAHGYPPGVLMIDDNWNQDYGVWRFRSDRFPDPARMVATLHASGFQVMLWVCPYVSPDGVDYLRLRDAGLLVAGPDSEPRIRRWWNGHSAVLDLTNPAAVDWFRSQLGALQDEYGIDGFKFDGADPDMYSHDDVTAGATSPSDQVHRYGLLAEEFEFNELRSGWDLGGRGLAMRLSDTNHRWDHTGIAKLVANHLAQGLVGLPFGAPDMIGGGQYLDVDEARIDQELFVRHAQVAALCPMMQFSAAPWRLLDDVHAAVVLDAVRLRADHQERIVALARSWIDSGDPIIRPLAYEFPGAGLDDVTDCFMLGDDLLVAPVIERAATTRIVPLPAGTWVDQDGGEHRGAQSVEVDVDIGSVPRFRLT